MRSSFTCSCWEGPGYSLHGPSRGTGCLLMTSWDRSLVTAWQGWQSRLPLGFCQGHGWGGAKPFPSCLDEVEYNSWTGYFSLGCPFPGLWLERAGSACTLGISGFSSSPEPTLGSMNQRENPGTLQFLSGP